MYEGMVLVERENPRPGGEIGQETGLAMQKSNTTAATVVLSQGFLGGGSQVIYSILSSTV